ncbi:hypothetical protein BT93_J1642 [Corymbia citriodora subsp. variegata]|nr:hypothetical protein BT93_J1642 [Corymbia citriodora subsp. variegata]
MRELWKEWELRLLVLLSLFLQLTLASQGSRRKSIYKNWIQVVVWTTYLLADSIATLTLGVLSHRLATIEETKGTIDPKSRITAFWAPFLLLHLGGPDTVTAYALADNELWPRQLARLCVQLGVAGYIYSMALSESTLWMLAEGMILVGLIKYAERSLCLFLASRDQLRNSMLPRPEVGPIYPRKMEQFTLKKEEGYRVGADEIIQIPGPEDLSVSSGRDPLVQAHKLFKIFKLFFVGLTVNSVDLEVSRRMFMGGDMGSAQAFKIVEIELGFMYDLLFTKAPLLNLAWGIVRWVISLSVPGAILVFFSLQDKKDYPTVDICITFLLMSVVILLEIYSLLLAISSDWNSHWRLQRPGRSSISSANALLQFSPSRRWSNSVAQFHLLRSSIRRGKSIFRHPRLAKLHVLVEKNFYISYQNFDRRIKGLIFDRMTEMVGSLEQTVGLNGGLVSLKLEASRLLKYANCDHLRWSLDDMEFDQSILIWHIATELCYYKERGGEHSDEDDKNIKMSMLVSRYMLYLLIFYPSMLPIGIGVVRYEDTVVEAQKFFDNDLTMLSKKEDSISSVVIAWAHKLFKKEARVRTCFGSCKKPHKSRGSSDLCKLCHILLRVKTDLPARKLRGAKSTSVLFDACRLANQLKSVDTWYIISKVWVRMLVHAACECKGHEHCESLSRGGELLSHVWLLMAHLGVAQPVQTSRAPVITKLIAK